MSLAQFEIRANGFWVWGAWIGDVLMPFVTDLRDIPAVRCACSALYAATIASRKEGGELTWNVLTAEVGCADEADGRVIVV